VSTETIYQSLYVQSRGALNRELTKYLRTGRALRKPGRATGQRKNRIPDMAQPPLRFDQPKPACSGRPRVKPVSVSCRRRRPVLRRAVCLPHLRRVWRVRRSSRW